MTIDQYHTIKELATAEFKDKGSRFIAYSFPAHSIEEFEKGLEEIKKEHFKARHHCYAYRIGIEGDLARANDDGEPSGSAGLPILNQLRSKELCNAASVVVRYFGGTKLGVSGLINAYKTSTAQSIDNAEIILTIVGKKVQIYFDYSQLGRLMNILKKKELNMIEKSFEAEAYVTLEIRESVLEETMVDLKAALCSMSIEEYLNKKPKMENYKFIELA